MAHIWLVILKGYLPFPLLVSPLLVTSNQASVVQHVVSLALMCCGDKTTKGQPFVSADAKGWQSQSVPHYRNHVSVSTGTAERAPCEQDITTKPSFVGSCGSQ